MINILLRERLTHMKTFLNCRGVMAMAALTLSFGALAQQAISPVEKLLIDKQYEAFATAANEAEKKEDAEALFLLGKSYDLGWGVEKDLDKAIEYYEHAAKLGSARAWHNLGLIQEDMNRLDKAAQFLEKALALGLKTPTLSNLGAVYLRGALKNAGSGDPRMFSLAMDYLAQSYALAPNDYTLGKLVTASAYVYRYTSEESALHVEAGKWLDAGVAKGLPAAFNNYGAIYYYADRIAEAIPWFEKAAERKVPEAAYALGLIHMEGQGGVPKDEALALHWFEIASEKSQSAGEQGEESYGQSNARRKAHDIWARRAKSAKTIDDLQAAIVGLSPYVENPQSDVDLLTAQKVLRLRQIPEQNRQQPQVLPKGVIRFKECLTDVPGRWGIPIPDAEWRIVALRDPSSDLDFLVMKGLVAGKTDRNGCIHLRKEDSRLLRKALMDGLTLAWIESSHVTVLRLEQPVLQGKLRLVPALNMSLYSQ